MTLQVPVAGPPRALKSPRVAEAKLRNGLRVLVVRKATVPRLEVRLLANLGAARSIAAERVLAKTLTSGTETRSSDAIAEDIQGLGGTFGAGVGQDTFQVSASVLSSNAKPFLELVADILTSSTFPAAEVALERARSVQELEMIRSQAQVVAIEALRKRLYGSHRYGTLLPQPAAAGRVTPAALHKVMDTAIGPRGGIVVVVGDVQPTATIELLDATIGRWRTKVAADKGPAPKPVTVGPLLFVDRPGSVQTSMMIAGAIPPITSDETYALDLANTIFGGSFVSRWVDNIREQKGYTYSPHSQLSYAKLASHIEISADVGADVTAASLVETSYELGRMCALRVEEHELEAAKRYRTGIQSLRIQSQAGLASTLAGLVLYGLGVEHLRTYPKRIAAVTLDDVRAASEAYLAPSKLVTVLVGDASTTLRSVEALADVTVQRTA